eukprot:SAG11_NODE_1736_length_4344_cov_1.763722_2_plen_63_part_00
MLNMKLVALRNQARLSTHLAHYARQYIAARHRSRIRAPRPAVRVCGCMPRAARTRITSLTPA